MSVDTAIAYGLNISINVERACSFDWLVRQFKAGHLGVLAVQAVSFASKLLQLGSEFDLLFTAAQTGKSATSTSLHNHFNRSALLSHEGLNRLHLYI